MGGPFLVGTRGSPLALAQTQEVLTRLRAAHPRLRFDPVPIKTHGDEDYRKDLGTSLDGKRAFTKRIDDALLDHEIDFAVHSLKDVPAKSVAGLALAAIPPRVDPRDALVLASPGEVARPTNVRIGTSSLRRKAQLRALWPDALVTELHGNVGTRLRRLDAREFDSIVVAAAGLIRLGLEGRIAESFPTDTMTPAPGQGALAVQARSEDDRVLHVLSAIDDAATRQATRAERELAALVGGDCNVPFGAVATHRGDRLALHAMLAAMDGTGIVRASVEGAATDPSRVAEAAWRQIKQAGGEKVLEEMG